MQRTLATITLRPCLKRHTVTYFFQLITRQRIFHDRTSTLCIYLYTHLLYLFFVDNFIVCVYVERGF